MPDLTPGRTTTTHARTRLHARVAWASACAALSDTTAMAVPTRGDQHVEPASYVEIARRVKLAGQHLQFLAVVMMLEECCEWREVARVCGLPDTDTAKAIYEAKYAAFVTTSKGDPWTAPGMRSAIPASAYSDDPIGVAARLDEWCKERGLADGPLVPGLRPVTDGLY